MKITKYFLMIPMLILLIGCSSEEGWYEQERDFIHLYNNNEAEYFSYDRTWNDFTHYVGRYDNLGQILTGAVTLHRDTIAKVGDKMIKLTMFNARSYYPQELYFTQKGIFDERGSEWVKTTKIRFDGKSLWKETD